MKNIFATAIIAAVSVTPLVALTALAAQAEEKLFRLEVKNQAVENGKTLEMFFLETTRNPDNSEVEVSLISGGSVSSSMFTLRGMCGLTRERNESYFKTESLGGKPARYKVLFPKVAPPESVRPSKSEDKIWSLSECAMLKF
ncbi:hypothetical protein QN372_05115 [Undibacterium sp. RTI2.1]|uniref:hypothetical protein n=1 Tax=unclassified Undibacterium TaxID=2630295 RepID=UPI002AB50B1A|nr:MULTISPECIES: hypothetical protein [unclassified Undibacterium]MDY7539579.1 hypothetical protein [Undibacterium sp. 5I1]MEB0030118.1 hypothetical protein [Undibacterium sp. RTI2.1]MEB0116646.1 hypothetical protein [Undibacterium sp. RTI2.2]MEB0230471.1 hypothetical protein [Undibacterium sp. 10I3]MEB0258467.1 hypothetical protein [Undibacterium sp. 5I1]